MAHKDGDTRDVGGITYMRQGGVWLPQGAPAAGPRVLYPDPTVAFKNAENNRQNSAEGRAADKDARDAKKDARDAEIADRREARLDRQEAREAAKPPSEASVNAKMNSDAKVKAARSLKRQLGRMREIYDRSFKGSGFKSIKEWLPTDDGERFKAVAESMRADLKPLIRGPSEGTFTEGDQKLLDDLIPQPGSWDARNEERFSEIENRIRDTEAMYAPPKAPTAPPPPADSPTADNLTAATGDTRTEIVRGPVEKKLASMLADRKIGAGTIKAYAKANDFDVPGLEGTLAFRALNPDYKGSYDVRTDKIVPTTMLNRAMASPAATVAAQFGNATTGGFLDEIGGAAHSFVTGDDLSDSIAAANLAKQTQAATNPGSALAGNIMGGAAALLGGGAALRGVGAGMRPGLRAALGDSAYGALYGAGEQNDNRAMGAGLGAGAGLIGNRVGAGVMRGAGATMRGVVNPAADALRARGVPLTVGEVLGGGWKKAQDAMASIPVVGSMVERRALDGRQAFNRAAFNEAGETINAPINATGQQGVEALDGARSQAYRDALDPTQVDLNDPQFINDIGDLGNQIARIPDTDNARTAAMDAIQYRMGSAVQPDGTLTGRDFQEAYRGLSRAGRERGPNTAYAHEFGQVMRSGQDALTGTLQRQAPEAYEGFLNANNANRHLNILADAVNAAKNQDDVLFTPAQLGTAATANARNFASKVAAARGDRPFNDLALAGQQVMGQRLPDSGTAARAMVGLGLTSLGGGAAGYDAADAQGAVTGALAPAAVLTALGTRRGQAALTAALLRRGAQFRRVGNATVDLAPYGGDLAGLGSVFGVQSTFGPPR